MIEIDIGFLISESLEDIEICTRKERKILGLLDLTFPFVLSFECVVGSQEDNDEKCF